MASHVPDGNTAAECLPDYDLSSRAWDLDTRADDEDDTTSDQVLQLQAAASASPPFQLPGSVAVHAEQDVYIGQEVHVGYNYSNISHNRAEQIVYCDKFVCNKYSNYQMAAGEAASFSNIRDQTKAELSSSQQRFVDRHSYRQAVHEVTDHGLLLISGPPGSGKSMIARAVLTHFESQGYIPLILQHAREWRQHVGSTHRLIVLLEHMFGAMFFKCEKFEKVARFFCSMRELARSRKCLTVFTAYPNIVQEMRNYNIKDNMFKSVPVVSLHDCVLSTEERKDMIRKHTVAQDMSEREDLCAQIITRDTSGCVFPWCLKMFLEAFLRAEDDDMSIFSKPAMSYASLLSRGLKHKTHGNCLAATLLLLVKASREPDCFMESLQSNLKELGLQVCREQCVTSVMRNLYQLFGHLQMPRSIDHQMNMAAGITLASSEFNDAFLKYCDLRFLMEIVSTELLTSSGNWDSFHQRIYKEILLGRLPEICQHRLLQSERYLQDFAQFCTEKRLPIHNLFTVTDPGHKEPILYWSAFCPSSVFSVWCVSQMLACGAEKGFVSVCLQRVLLVSVLSGDSPSSEKVRQIVCELRKLPAEPVSPQKMILPFPKNASQFTSKCEHLKRHGSYYLHSYLRDGILPYDGVHVFINEVQSYFRLEMTEFHWYLALRRVQADRALGLHDQDMDGNTYLHLAAKYGNPEAMRFALKAGASVTMRNNDGASPTDLAQKRLQNSPNQTTQTELHVACQHGQIMLVKKHLCLDATVLCTNGEGNTPLHSACGAGQISIASLLLELGANINARSGLGLTPLSVACRYGYHETTNFLLQHNANANIADNGGWTPLHHATFLNKRFIILLLLNSDAAINAKTVVGDTPLHIACRGGNMRTVKQLLEEGTKVNAKNRQRETSLHVAAEGNSTDIIHLLCQCGANLNLKDVNGRTATERAHMLRSGIIYALLLKYKTGVVEPFADDSFPDETPSSAVFHQINRRGNISFDAAPSGGNASTSTGDENMSAQSSVTDVGSMFSMESLSISTQVRVDRRAVIQEQKKDTRWHRLQMLAQFCLEMHWIKLFFVILLILTMPRGCV